MKAVDCPGVVGDMLRYVEIVDDVYVENAVILSHPVTCIRYSRQVHFIPIVGVGKRFK